jgi:hypothetical protein
MVDSLSSVDITSIVNNVLDVGVLVLNYIAGNSILSTLFCGSLVGLGCYVIKKVKDVATGDD